MTKTVRIGYEVGTGEAVDIPLGLHMCVTGQTQLSGKTTLLEGLIARSKVKAVAFVTKRGESSFSLLNSIVGSMTACDLQPFFRHRADWQFVSDILGAILSEKLKFQRSWIMKVCRNARTLRDVQANVDKALLTARGLNESVYTELAEYFKLLMPELDRLPSTDKLSLRPGLNIMDLHYYSTALQMLVISSVIQRVYEREKAVVTVMPEAWQFVPNGKSSPVKSAAIDLIRKGAALGNVVWVDSQDLVGIDTIIRNACGVYVMGVQRGETEIKRSLSHIPASVKKPKAEDLMTLGKGQFFVCHGREMRLVYAQPAWLTEAVARDIAMGRCSVEQFPRQGLPNYEGSMLVDVAPHGITHDFVLGDTIIEPDNSVKPGDYQMMPRGLPHWDKTVAHDHGSPSAPIVRFGEGVGDGTFRGERRAGIRPTMPAIIDDIDSEEVTDDMPCANCAELERRIRQLEGLVRQDFEIPVEPFKAIQDFQDFGLGPVVQIEELIAVVIERLRSDPKVIELSKLKPEIAVHIKREVIRMDLSTLEGRLALLISEGFLDIRKRPPSIANELARRGWGVHRDTVSKCLRSDFAPKGFVTYDPNNGFKVVDGMKVNIVEDK